MYISPDDVESALLRIFTELQIPVGSTLSHAYLLKRWREKRLRHSDLDGTLSRLIRARLMTASDAVDGRVFALTALGHERAAALRTGGLRVLLHRFKLATAQVLRWQGPGEPARPRRLIDRHAPHL